MNPYTVKTMAAELSDYAAEVLHAANLHYLDLVNSDEAVDVLKDIARRMKNTAKQATE